MWQYVIKRLLLLAFTLFLAVCIGFLITRMAPGDPAALQVQGMGQGGGRDAYLSQEIVEQNRELYGFDKAIFFNVQVDDRQAHAQELLEKLQRPSEYSRKRARVELSEINKIAIPFLIDALERAEDPALRSDLVSLLQSVTENVRDLPPYPESLSQASQWREWWQANREFFSEAATRSAVEAFLEDSTAENRRAVLRRGALANEFLMPHVDDPAHTTEVTSLLADINKKIWVVKEGSSDTERREQIWRWKNWWRHNKDEYVVFEGVEHFVRRFTDTQFGIWFGRILRWDFGESYMHKQPVLDVIMERLPISLQLSLISIFISYLVAIPLGIFSATHQYSKTDSAITVGLFVMYSLPSFWVADMLILFLTGGSFWDIFPSRFLHSPGAEEWGFWRWFKDWVWHLILPITCLTYTSFAFLSRQMRVSMLETVRQDFIRTARAKGLSERVVIFKHALRNSMIPILTLMAGLLPELLGGSVIIESIFTIEGMGKLTFDAILNRDYPVINAIIFFSSFLTMLGILLSDLSYALVDPRIKYQ